MATLLGYEDRRKADTLAAKLWKDDKNRGISDGKAGPGREFCEPGCRGSYIPPEKNREAINGLLIWRPVVFKKPTDEGRKRNAIWNAGPKKKRERDPGKTLSSATWGRDFN